MASPEEPACLPPFRPRGQRQTEPNKRRRTLVGRPEEESRPEGCRRRESVRGGMAERIH